MGIIFKYIVAADVVLRSISMTVRIGKQTAEEHPRETHDDALKRLIKAWKERTRSRG